MDTLAQAVIDGNAPVAKEQTEQGLESGLPPATILQEGLMAGMQVVGDRFKRNEFYVPEVLLAARAMKTAMEVLRPHLVAADVEPVARIAIATVKGDLHDIGKNLVGMMMEGAGFEVIDLGVDASPDQFVEAVREQKAQVVGVSALLTTTMVNMRDVIEGLKDAGLRDQVKVLIGGAPVTEAFADEVGADGYAPDAATAVDVARDLLGLPAAATAPA
ncbi:MAG: cobalamin-binding protein [Dehalococcoidia bacterium]|nr:cobalamin-binding protein [Dehalococcoidia bacterium]